MLLSVSISRTALSFKPDLGTADMDFVPCSGESELVVVRTLEVRLACSWRRKEEERGGG